MRTARAKGAGENTLLWHHAFRNAVISLITLFGGMLPALVSGSVIVEHIFSIPGMGTLALNSLSSRDYPLQMALFAIGGGVWLAHDGNKPLGLALAAIGIVSLAVVLFGFFTVSSHMRYKTKAERLAEALIMCFVLLCASATTVILLFV